MMDVTVLYNTADVTVHLVDGLDEDQRGSSTAQYTYKFFFWEYSGPVIDVDKYINGQKTVDYDAWSTVYQKISDIDRGELGQDYGSRFPTTSESGSPASAQAYRISSEVAASHQVLGR